MVWKHMEYDDHEAVHYVSDARAGLRAIIAVHSTQAGPALGGCRMQPYVSEDAALADVLRLSRGMTYKAAMANLPFGGGKTVLFGDPRRHKTPQLFHALGHAIAGLGGRYATGEDVGTTAEDMVQIAKATGHVMGLPEALGGSGDPSFSTALGCFVAIRVSVEHWLGEISLDRVHVAVQGLGNVGYNLCKLLHEAGARMTVTDVRGDIMQACAKNFDAETVAPDDIFDCEADVFAPCALGSVLNTQSIARLKAKIVAGAANNQLATIANAGSLRARGILYAPDYVVNAGGMIQLAGELTKMTRDDRMLRIRGIGDTLREVYARSELEGISTASAAEQIAKEKCGLPNGSR